MLFYVKEFLIIFPYFSLLQNSCGAKIGIRRALLNRPDVVSIGVVWDSERPPADQVHAVLKSIGTSLRLCDVFHQVSDARWAQSVNHELVGIVSYYGKHYTTFFFHTKLRVWVYFDDANVKEVGPDWEGVVDKCSRGRYQPLLLLYALPQPQPMQQQQPASQKIYTQQEITQMQQSQHRRAVTPSPEKPPIGSTRRAITPTPNRGVPVCDYQNLSVIQSKIFPNEDKENYISRKAVENVINAQYQNLSVIQDKIFQDHEKDNGYVTKSMIQRNKQMNLHRSLSAESHSPPSSTSSDGLSIPEHLNQPRRRDSGNWSGDRNSASSSSSTTLDSPYLYLVGKRNGSVPASPTRSNNGQFYDAGYDSYSLSSTDSFPPKHHLSTNMHLAKITESVVLSGDCEKLCSEADQLLEKSRVLEEAHDLETALVLCNAAVSKARAAMDAPYSNPHTMAFARMKHNTCIMKARTLHRKISIERGGEIVKEQQQQYNMNMLVNALNRRQNIINGQIQNKKDSLSDISMSGNSKNIEIYATLPKKKVTLKLMETAEEIEAVEVVKPERESRSLFGRSKDSKDKRSRSEDRNKIKRDFQLADASLVNAKDTLKKQKEKEEKSDDKKEKDSKSGKKQHKIRRRLLMGGLIRRKNRSMPDLTEGNADEAQTQAPKPIISTDDSAVGLGGSNENTNSGYLSEGHFEFQVSNTNPNLERSKLMRKSFHGSGKTLTAMAKVPPPPPVRVGSALSPQQQQQQQQQAVPQNPPPQMLQVQKLPLNGTNLRHLESYAITDNQPIKPFHEANVSNISTMSSNTSMSEDSCQTIITTSAVVHQEQSPLKPTNSVEEVDSVGKVDPSYRLYQEPTLMELPPYPSPPSTTCHSRQASEDFPPPPPAIDLEPLNEQLNEIHSLQTNPPPVIQNTTSILAQLQQKQLLNKLSQEREQREREESQRSENWLKELQAKHLSMKQTNNQNSVRDLASRFEQAKILEKPPNVRTGMSGLLEAKANKADVDEVDCPAAYKMLPKPRYDIAQSQIQEEIREVEMLNQVVQQTLNSNLQNTQVKRTKKKSVSFCDQVILVATADDQEDDDFIPNPILERVLRSANGQENDEIRQQQSSPVNYQMKPPVQNYCPPQQPQQQQQPPPTENGYPYAAIPTNANAYKAQPFYNGNPGEIQKAMVYQPPPQQYPQNNNYSPYMTVPHHPMEGYQTVSASPTMMTNTTSSQAQQNGFDFPMPMTVAMRQQMMQQQRLQQQQVYQKPPQPMNYYPQQSPYQRVPMSQSPSYAPDPLYVDANLNNLQMPMYQQPPLPQQQLQQQKMVQKKVTFEAGTKGGSDCPPSPQPMLVEQNGLPTRVAIATGYNNNAIVKQSAKAIQCNLCRKKHVLSPATYCADCEFYMSRFQVRR